MNQSYHVTLLPVPVTSDIEKPEPLASLNGLGIIVTGTFYRSENDARGVRADRAYDTIQQIKDAGLDVLVMDGGSHHYFLDRIRELDPRVERESQRGIGPGRREGVKLALEDAIARDIPYLGWTEPEKDSLVNDYAQLFAALRNGADCVRPLRTRNSWSSYPTHQRYTEIAGNLTLKDNHGFFADHFVGPFLWKRNSTGYVLEEWQETMRAMDLPRELVENGFEQDDRWGSNIFPPILMHRAGKRVVSVETDFQYPTDQRDEEEGDPTMADKRTFQLRFLTLTSNALAKYLAV